MKKKMHMLLTDHDEEHHDPWHNLQHLFYSVVSLFALLLLVNLHKIEQQIVFG